MKYPRTPHLPGSPGGTNDDRRLANLDSFRERVLVVTEKMDGSNVCLQREACYARSHSQPPNHPSFDMFKAFHASVQHKLPLNIQVFGEWLYAKHSIHYTRLSRYFMIFGVRDTSRMTWASWGEVELWADELGIHTVPHLFDVPPGERVERIVEKFASDTRSKAYDGEREGFVIRWSDEFHDDEFSQAVGKWVRANHVTTPDHWKSLEIVRNRLASEW